MAACCIIVAIILAQITMTLRRWGVFWGFIRPDDFDDPDTILRRLRFWLARPGVRIIAAAVLAVEVAAFGWWVYSYHGQHLYHLADEAAAGLSGRALVYGQVCGGSARANHQRISLARDRVPLR